MSILGSPYQISAANIVAFNDLEVVYPSSGKPIFDVSAITGNETIYGGKLLFNNNNTTGYISLLSTNNSLVFNATGIQFPTITNGFLTSDSKGNISTTIPSNITGIPFLPQYETLVGNSGNVAQPTTDLEINSSNIVFNKPTTGSSAFFTTLTDSTNIFSNNVTGVSAFFTTITGTNSSFSNLNYTTATGTNEYLTNLNVSGTGSFNYLTATNFVGPIQGNVTYFFNHSNLSTSLTGFHSMSQFTDGHAETTTTYAMTGTESNLLVESYCTEVGDPNVSTLLNGAWALNTWTVTSGGSNAVIYATISQYRNGTLFSLLGTYPTEVPLTSNNELDIDVILGNISWIPTTDQLVIQFYANQSGTNRTLTYYWEGASHYSHIHTPVFQPVPSSIPTLSITSTLDSSSPSTGALTVSGGEGISKSLQVGTSVTAGTSLNAPSISGNSGFFSSITGTSLITSPLFSGSSHSGSSAFFTTITGTNIYGSTSLNTPLTTSSSVSGASAFFTTITGTSSISSPLFTGTSHSGASAFFTTITGTNIYGSTSLNTPLTTSSSVSGVSAFFTTITGTAILGTNITGTNGFFTNLSATNLAFPSTDTITNLTATNLMTTNMTGTTIYFGSATGGSLNSSNIQLGNNGILDTNGKEILALSPAASSVNYLTALNSNSGSRVGFSAVGSDPNIGISLNPKGTNGDIYLNTGSSGTTYINSGLIVGFNVSGINLTINSGGNLLLNNTANTFFSAVNANTCTSNAIYVMPPAPPVSTQFLSSTSGGTMAWNPTTGSGNVVLANGPTLTGTVSASTISVGTALYLPTSGGTASSLNYYEELKGVTITLSGVWASNPTTTANFIRIGAMVMMEITSAVTATTNSSGTSYSLTGIPSRMLPTNSGFYQPLMALNGVLSFVVAYISVGNTSTSINYTIPNGTAGVGLPALCISWSVI